MLGLAVNFGFSGTDGIAATEFTGKLILQSGDVSLESDEEQVMNAVGSLATRNFYNGSKKATLEFVPTGSDIATAISNSTIGTAYPIGTLVNITACDSMPDLVCTSTQRWVIVPGVKISKTNNGAAKISLPLEFHAEIHA